MARILARLLYMRPRRPRNSSAADMMEPKASRRHCVNRVRHEGPNGTPKASRRMQAYATYPGLPSTPNKRSPPRVNRAGFDGAWRLGRASGRGRSGQEPQGNSRRLLAVMRLPEAYCTAQLPESFYHDAVPNGLQRPRSSQWPATTTRPKLTAATQLPMVCCSHAAKAYGRCAAPNGLLQPRSQSLRALRSSQRATSGRPRGGP